MLVGDAIVVGMPDRDGNSTNVPEAFARALVVAREFRVDVVLRHPPEASITVVRCRTYWEATVWAALVRERWTDIERIRIVPDYDTATARR